MSQIPSDSSQDSADSQDALSLGGTLRAMREARGLGLPEVSSRIKFSVAQLRHLEADDWPSLPKGVPLRGLVRNYARFLDADADILLRLLDQAVGPLQSHSVVTPQSTRRVLQQADMTPKGEPAHRTWAWLLLILVLFCVVGLYAIDRGWVPDRWLVFDWLKALRQ